MKLINLKCKKCMSNVDMYSSNFDIYSCRCIFTNKANNCVILKERKFENFIDYKIEYNNFVVNIVDREKYYSFNFSFYYLDISLETMDLFKKFNNCPKDNILETSQEVVNLFIKICDNIIFI